MRNDILIVGALPPPITGQSIITSKVVQVLDNKANFINTVKYGSRSPKSFLYVFKKLPIYLLSCDRIYITPSRTLGGSFRDVLVIITALICRKSLVAHLHGVDFNALLKEHGVWSKTLCFFYNKVSCFVLLYPAMYTQIAALKEPNFTVIPNCFDSSLKSDIITSKGLFDKERKTISYLSNIMSSKGIFEFLDLSEELLERNQNLFISIAGAFLGDDEMTKYEVEKSFLDIFRKLSDRYGDRIEYLGIVRGLKKEELLLKTDILCFPTRYKMEAQPLVLIEALYYGCSIIFSDHNDLKNQFCFSNNLCFKDITADDVLRQFNRKEKVQQRKTNHSFALTNFSVEKFSSNIINLLS